MDVSIMNGMTLSKIKVERNEEIFFSTTEGRHFLMYHRSQCCEYVVIDDICGSLDNLIGNPLLVSEEVSNETPPPLDRDILQICYSQRMGHY